MPDKNLLIDKCNLVNPPMEPSSDGMLPLSAVVGGTKGSPGGEWKAQGLDCSAH